MLQKLGDHITACRDRAFTNSRRASVAILLSSTNDKANYGAKQSPRKADP